MQEYVDAGCTCPVLYPLGDDVPAMIEAFATAAVKPELTKARLTMHQVAIDRATLVGRDFIETLDWTVEEIEEALAVAGELKAAFARADGPTDCSRTRRSSCSSSTSRPGHGTRSRPA